MIFSPMKWFCNCCGTEMSTPTSGALGRNWRVCSKQCSEEIQWKETLSIMGKDYYPREQKTDEPC